VSRLATSFVLGYHGCEQAIAEQAIQGQIDILQSDRDYDWLGPGAYFWESDPLRALEWAVQKGSAAPAVIGAVIDLGNCLDLVSRQSVELLRQAYQLYERQQMQVELRLAQNLQAPGRPDPDNILRFLDCAVIRFLHGMIAEQDRAPFDTVRGLFTEGDAVYPGSGFKNQSHTQVAVRNPACILGIFKPIPYPQI